MAQKLALAAEGGRVHVQALNRGIADRVAVEDAPVIGAPGEVRVPIVGARIEEPVLAAVERRFPGHEVALEAVAVRARGREIRHLVEVVVQRICGGVRTGG